MLLFFSNNCGKVRQRFHYAMEFTFLPLISTPKVTLWNEKKRFSTLSKVANSSLEIFSDKLVAPQISNVLPQYPVSAPGFRSSQ